MVGMVVMVSIWYNYSGGWLKWLEWVPFWSNYSRVVVGMISILVYLLEGDSRMVCTLV